MCSRQALSIFLVAAVIGCSPSAEPADLLFLNGTVHTAEDAQPTAEAVAVRGDSIVFVGSSADAARYRGDRTEVVDLGGKVLLPGLTDAHAHLAGVGERELSLNLEGTQSLADMLSRVKARVDQAAPGE